LSMPNNFFMEFIFTLFNCPISATPILPVRARQHIATTTPPEADVVQGQLCARSPGSQSLPFLAGIFLSDR